MAFTVTVAIDKEFEAECPIETAFAVVADVPESASHFPKLAELYEIGDNTYLWEMEKVGVGKYYLQTSYACKYTSDAAKGTVTWTPVKGEGNAQVKGKWTLKKAGPKKTKLRLATNAVLEVPLPSLVKVVVSPIVGGEFERLVDQYIENLKETFNQ